MVIVGSSSSAKRGGNQAIEVITKEARKAIMTFHMFIKSVKSRIRGKGFWFNIINYVELNE